MCRYESLRDGSLTLEDVYLMNQYLDNEMHNRAEWRRITNGKRA